MCNNMFLIFFVCIHLSILHVCVSDFGYYCTKGSYNNKNTIRLIGPSYDTSDDNIVARLNDKFIEKCQEFYRICVIDTKDLTNVGPDTNIINLYVTNYNITDIEETQEQFEYVVYDRDIRDNAVPTICVTDNGTETICKETIVKLVTKPVKDINSGDLFDFVTKMEITEGEIHTRDSCYSVIQEPKELKAVLLCLNTGEYRDIPDNIEPLKLEVTYDCQRYIEKFNNNYLAVLIPTPSEMEFGNSVPTIFYNTPYMLPEYKTYFPNSMNLVPWQMLKYVYIEFLKRIQWSRVVILSDDSVYSTEFENELTELFNAEGIVYTVIRSEDAEFNLTKAILTLYKIGAKIVVANVEERNIHDLIGRSSKWFIWLVRDFEVSVPERNIFYFTLGAAGHHPKYYNLNDTISEGINRIAQAYRYMTDSDFALNKQEFYRNFAEAINNMRRNEAIGYVKQTQSQEPPVLSMEIDGTGIKNIQFNDPYKNVPRPQDAPCLLRSNHYMEPCDDILALVLMLVVIMFATTLLLITCYFHKTSPFHDIRYQNF